MGKKKQQRYQHEIDAHLAPLHCELEGGRDESHVYEVYGSAGNNLTEYIVALADAARHDHPLLVLDLLRAF